MGILDLASFQSQLRGYDYYKENRAQASKKMDGPAISGLVLGSNQNIYHVSVDLKHPRRSVCDCPFANGRRVICKHMIALYFEAFPDEADSFYSKIMSGFEGEQDAQEQLEYDVMTRLHKMKKAELEVLASELLFSGPDWLLNRFIREYMDDY